MRSLSPYLVLAVGKTKITDKHVRVAFLINSGHLIKVEMNRTLPLGFAISVYSFLVIRRSYSSKLMVFDSTLCAYWQ